MKFTVNKSAFSEALTNILRVVSSKSTIPALEGVLFVTNDKTIELTAYDLEIGMKTVIDADITTEGKIVIPAKLIAEIVRKAPSDNINITINDKNVAEITSGNSEFSIVCINPDEFIQLPSIGNENSIKINTELLKGMINQTIFATADNDSKPINQGSLFNIEDGVFDLVSVDGYRLAMRKERVNLSERMNFIVPGKALSELVKLNGDEEIEIFPGRRHIMFKIGNYTLVSSVLEGEFLDYKTAIPKNGDTLVHVNTRKFIESTERVSLLINDRLKSPVKCIFEDNFIKLSCNTAIGKANDELECTINGPSLQMGFNNKYLLDALKHCDCDEILIKITGAINPMVICPPEGDNFLFLVLPVRLK